MRGDDEGFLDEMRVREMHGDLVADEVGDLGAGFGVAPGKVGFLPVVGSSGGGALVEDGDRGRPWRSCSRW